MKRELSLGSLLDPRVNDFSLSLGWVWDPVWFENHQWADNSCTLLVGSLNQERKRERVKEKKERKEARLCFMNQVIPVGKLRKNLYISIFKIYIYIYIYLHKNKSARIYEKERRLSWHDGAGAEGLNREAWCRLAPGLWKALREKEGHFLYFMNAGTADPGRGGKPESGC